MQVIADLHFHSKYSRAVSPDMVLPEIARWAAVKGIDLVTTTDFTHPLWLRELRANLEEAEEGTYRLKGQKKPLFILTTEISSIYTQGGRLRRIHNLVFAPNLGEAGRIEEQLASRGNVMSDGRPIFGLSAREITEIILDISPESLIIPAHAWTPHFSLYGSESGFDSMEECFGNMAKNIYAIETGLSSDPAMNWRIGELDNRSIISCSDAHSGAKLGREATVFAPSENGTSNLSYLIRKGLIINLSVHYTLQSFPEIAKPTRGCRFCVSENRPSFPIPLEPVSTVYLALYNGARTFADLWDKIDNLDDDMLNQALNRLEKIGAVEIERGEGNYIRAFKYIWGWRESTKAGG